MYYGSVGGGLPRLWVTQHTNNRKMGPSRTSQIVEENEDDTLSESDMSWVENVFGEAPLSQWSLDDENTPMQEDEHASQEESKFGEDDTIEHEDVPLQQEEKRDKRAKSKKTNVDYSKKKLKKRRTHVTIGYREALITKNPQSTLAKVEVGYDVDMGVSVYVKRKPLHKGDYVTHYAVKGTMTVEEYVTIYDNKKNYTPNVFQPR